MPHSLTSNRQRQPATGPAHGTRQTGPTLPDSRSSSERPVNLKRRLVQPQSNLAPAQQLVMQLRRGDFRSILEFRRRPQARLDLLAPWARLVCCISGNIEVARRPLDAELANYTIGRGKTRLTRPIFGPISAHATDQDGSIYQCVADMSPENGSAGIAHAGPLCGCAILVFFLVPAGRTEMQMKSFSAS
ncbi:hypothetical protein BD289DRAFT_57273 [Coniella lustricola]|uniref:Uncharacterized protein n=1 Tax=Coniella lustricola TaxID=2025994 RepID=A0A2T3AI66_9PEZI|nr:hypothetical protein BD289DRAFT_57273 [Coniella lustricola]